MSTADVSANTEPTPEPITAPGIRVRPAVIMLSVAVLLIAGLQLFPGEWLPAQFRNVGSLVVGTLAVAGLLVWLAFFSRLPARVRLAAVVIYVAVFAVPYAMIRNIDFTGDMVPHFDFIWEPDPLAALEAHRRQAAESASDALPATDFGADFPGFRGADRSGVYAGTPIRTNWEANPPELLWRQPIGEGYSQIVVSGNFAVTIEQRGDEETVACYDALTGQELWIHAYPTRFVEGTGGDGPRATPTIVDDVVYALGANGHLTSLNLPTGTRNWQINILAEYESSNLEWGMAGSPLVLNDLIIVNPGAPYSAAGKSLVAYDRHTGELVWAVGDSTAAYSSPVYAEIAGTPQILTLEADSAASYSADGSRELWRYPWVTMNGINCSQPLPISDDRVLITAGYTMGSVLLKITPTDDGTLAATPLWEETSLRGKFATPVVTDEAIFGLDEGVLVAVNLETGKRNWKKGRYGHGQVLLTNGVLFIQCEDGDIALVAADPEEYRELARIPVFPDRTWNTPALAAGHAFIRNHREMACYDLTAATAD